MESNFILLIHKTDFIDLFKNGRFNSANCPNVKFDGNIKALVSNKKLVEKLFKNSNFIDYSIDYLLLHICKKGSKLGILQIKDVISVYALDDAALSIGLDMNPAVILNPPILQDAFEQFQIQTNISKALEGVKLIAELWGIDQLRFPKIKKIDLYDIFASVYFETEPRGDLSPWSYLLRYERHENYPKDNRGYFIDALHVFGNVSRKLTFHDSVIEKSRKGKELYNCIGFLFKDLTLLIKKDKIFIKKVKAVTGCVDFIPIAALFLTLKDYFKDGIDEERMYEGKTLEDFISAVKKIDAKYLKPALYLLGLTLGWDNIYKLMYKRWDLPILKKNNRL